MAAMGHAGKRSTACSFIRGHAHRVRPAGAAQLHSPRVPLRVGLEARRLPRQSRPSAPTSVRPSVRARNVLFFVSGGVDSTVVYKLCADALGQDRVHGVYVDTGFMRKNESADVMAAYERAGFKNVRLRDASAEFLGGGR